MHLLTIGLLLIPLAIVGWQQQSAMQTILEQELDLTILDNVTIGLGRNDRSLAKFLTEQESKLRKLHRRHHSIHACAVSARDPICKAADASIELEIAGALARVSAEAQLRWSHAGVDARRMMSRKTRKQLILLRPLLVPIDLQKCPNCHLGEGWRWRLNDGLTARLSVASSIPEQTILGLNRNKTNYWIRFK